jgi:hypothetical protein
MTDNEHLKAITEWMRAEMEAHQERMMAIMKAGLGKREVRINWPGTNEAKIKTSLEEMRATNLVANPKEIEAAAEHQQVPKEEAVVETTGTLEDRFEDQQLPVEYSNPWKRWTKDDDVHAAPKDEN